MKVEGQLCTISQDECQTGLACKISEGMDSMATCQRSSVGMDLHERCVKNEDCESLYCAMPNCDANNPFQNIGISNEQCKTMGGRCQMRPQFAARLDFEAL